MMLTIIPDLGFKSQASDAGVWSTKSTGCRFCADRRI